MNIPTLLAVIVYLAVASVTYYRVYIIWDRLRYWNDALSGVVAAIISVAWPVMLWFFIPWYLAKRKQK